MVGLIAAVALITGGIVALLDLQEAAHEERRRERAASMRAEGDGATLRGSSPHTDRAKDEPTGVRRVLTARVVSKDTGLPMAKVQVELHWTRSGDPADGRFIDWTREDGTVTFRSIPPGNLDLICRVVGQGWHERRASENELYAPAEAHEFTTELVAVGGRVLTGVVRTPAGEAVPFQEVLAKFGDQHIDTIWGMTDAAGRFEFRGLPEAHLAVRTESRWDQPDVPLAYALVEADARHVELVLREENDETIEMVFHVRGPRGRVIRNCFWRLWSAVEGRVVQVGDAFHVEAAMGGAWLEVWGAQDDEEQRLPLKAGLLGPVTGPGPHTLELEADVPLPGRVTNEAGEPVAGATVVAATVHAGDGWPPDHLRYHTAESAEDGSFVLHHLPHRRFRLHVSAPPGHAHPDPRTVSPSDGFVSISLRPAPDVTITVVDAEGEPLRGMHVRVLDLRIPLPFMIVDGADPRTVVADRTDDDGRVVLSSLPPDRQFELVVNGSGTRFRTESSTRYWTHTAAHWSPADTLVRLVRVRTIVGTVRGDTPLDRDGISVEVTTHDGHTWQVDVDEDGEFVLEDVPVAPLTLRVGPGDGRWSEPLSVDAAATTVVLDLPD